MVKHRTKALALAVAAATFGATGVVPVALGEETIEEVVVTGSRRAPRSVADSSAPIDVIGGDDFENQGSMDMGDMLRTLVPSYNVNTQPISDAATLVRPANLRGLPPDNTLVLVNGKRRHRGAVISFLGGGVSDGAQGADISAIPSIAIKQVEVLRDGAAAQYGSDAIAGVINFQLKDAAEGFSIEARYGETFEGDGESYRISANLGLPLGPDGFANFSFETAESDATSRSVQRADAAALRAGGNLAVNDPAQIWGSPDISDDYKFFANIGLDLGDNKHAYLFGNYAERKVLGGFFFRNPTNRGGVFSVDGGVTRLVGDLTPGPVGQVNTGLGEGDGVACPVVNVRVDGTTNSDSPIDTGALASIIADPNCFVFNGRHPGGFTPNFGGTVTDYGIAAGVRGETEGGLLWDVSASIGSSDVQYKIVNTLNPSFGPESPDEFRPGDYTQFEKNFNADFSYPMEMGMYSPLNVGFGFEYREEQFEVTSVDQFSWDIGPLFDQGFGIGSNGFGGFGPKDAGQWDRGNYALYVDLEADVTERLLLGGAIRFEDFDDFGTTTNGKISARFAFTDSFAARATASTGFRAPTPGQSNISNISTVAGDDGILVQRGTIPPTNPVAVSKGGKALKEEESTNFSVGFVWDITDNINVTADYFSIEVEDRITQSATKQLSAGDIQDLIDLGVVGAGDLTEFRFYTNDFDTTTSGFDIVATYGFDSSLGSTDLNLAFNHTETELDSSTDVIDRERKGELEGFLPENRWYLTGVHHMGNWRFLARLSYYDEWTDSNNNPANDLTFGDEYLLDLEGAYTWNDRYSIIVGAQNVLDEFPDKEPRALTLGYKYPEGSPMGFNGGFYYTRFRVDM
jgi:iron complex outermembrane recepter protein